MMLPPLHKFVVDTKYISKSHLPLTKDIMEYMSSVQSRERAIVERLKEIQRKKTSLIALDIWNLIKEMEEK